MGVRLPNHTTAVSVSRARRCRPRIRLLIRWFRYFESNPVSRGEYLLRAVPNSAHYCKLDLPDWICAMDAFLPSKNRDEDGMSFFREDFCTAKQVAAQCGHVFGAYVVRVKVDDILQVGTAANWPLAITPDPDPTKLPGHVIIPELRFLSGRPKKEKQCIKDCAQAIAKLASKGLCHVPSGISGIEAS